MPSEESFYQKLDHLQDCVSRIGDRVTHDQVPEIFTVSENEESGEIKLTGHVCTTDKNMYYVAGHPDLEYFGVIYHLSIRENIAQALDLESARNILDRRNISHEEGDPRMLAASQLLNENKNDNQLFESKFKYEISSSECLLDTIHNSEDTFVGYALTTYIFPYEDGFNISDFYDSVESVTGIGSRSAELVRQGIYVEEADESNEVAVRYNI